MPCYRLYEHLPRVIIHQAVAGAPVVIDASLFGPEAPAYSRVLMDILNGDSTSAATGFQSLF